MLTSRVMTYHSQTPDSTIFDLAHVTMMSPEYTISAAHLNFNVHRGP